MQGDILLTVTACLLVRTLSASTATTAFLYVILWQDGVNELLDTGRVQLRGVDIYLSHNLSVLYLLIFGQVLQPLS